VSRVRQFFTHLRARVTPDERTWVHELLPADAASLFDAMPVADRRHGLDVAAHLRAAGHDDRDLLAAALLHDAAKGHRMRLWHRVAGVLLAAALPGLLRRLASPRVSSWRYPFHLYLHHAELSARAAQGAGCSPRTAALIRGAGTEADGAALAALHLADEAS
jgi:hypothetical protein